MPPIVFDGARNESRNHGMDNGPRILLTGATGYIGGRLLPLLERRAVVVRCMARRPEYLQGRTSDTTEAVAADVLDDASLHTALADVDAAYYMIHSMGSMPSRPIFKPSSPWRPPGSGNPRVMPWVNPPLENRPSHHLPLW